ncbi:MAG TPA: TRAP transporter large permease subunit [Bryobacteraceae bacterium]|nr:TRAP transporter large permease subunit [Bryobacteraceae bacterium]
MSVATPPPENAAPATPLEIVEDSFSILALSLMTLLPVIEMVSRQFRWPGIPGSAVVVQQLTLWIGMLGGMLASRSDRLLGLSSSAMLPDSWRVPAKILSGAALAAVSTCLAWASWVFVKTERESGSELLPGVPKWTALAIMLVGFAVIALRAVLHASPNWQGRLLAAPGLVIPALLGFVIPVGAPGVMPLALLMLAFVTFLGLPIFAVFGGLALLLFWNSGTPAASVPVEMYRLVASPLLPSIPLFTLAGYFMVQGGATKRLLHVFTALFSWIPGGLAIATVAICTVFTFAGSGLTILSLGGLLVPMLIKTRYPENFSIGLLTASGSLGLLFPTSVPAILYCVYSNTPLPRLFTGAILPELLMVTCVAAVGIYMGLKHKAVREPFVPREAAAAVWNAKWELMLPVIMIVGLFGGFGTLTEAAALTAFCAFVVEVFIYRDLKLNRDYREVFVECATIVGGILLILGVALGFTNYLIDAEVPSKLIDWVRTHVQSKYVFLLLLNAALLVVGALMDIFAAILVVVPLIKPLAAAYSIDPVQMGVIFIANLELGYLHPPVGINLFLSAYRFKKPMGTIIWATLPFLFILMGSVLLITYVPWLTTAPLRWFGK